MGCIQVQTCRDNILRSWYEVGNYTAFQGEKVISGLWFHPGIKLTVSPDKVDNFACLWGEKFIHAKFAPSVRQFGRKAADGFMAISSSGLVFALVTLADGSVITGTDTIGNFRCRLKSVDIAYSKEGHFLIVTTNGSVDSSIRCFTIKVQITNGHPDRIKCAVVCQPLSSFYLNASESNAPIETYSQISHVRFALREGSDSVIVTTSGAAGSTIELWELKEKPVILHKKFQLKPPVVNGKKEEDEVKKEDIEPNGDSAMDTSEDITVKKPDISVKSELIPTVEQTPCPVEKNQVFLSWERHASDTHPSPVASLSTPKFSLFDSPENSSIFVAVFQDNTMKCLSREGLKEVCKVQLPLLQGRPPSDSTKNNISPKSAERSVNTFRLTDLSFTWNGCALIGITSSSELVTVRFNSPSDVASPLVVGLPPQTLLESCILSGNDWWDIQITLRASVIDALCESLHASLLKQPLPVQTPMFIRLHELKGCLYRSLPATSSSSFGQVKAGDAHAIVMLYSVSTFLKSLLRARDNQEKEGPAENLTTLIQTKGKDFLNVDKVLMELEHKEFFVETVILQSLQNLNQWVADITLYLLASLPWQVHKNYRFPGGSLIHDTKSLNLLRELLVVIRIWGLINESCLPLFTRLNGDLDVIAHLFKMLTVRVGAVGSEADETLLEECYRLPNQVLVNQPSLVFKARGVASPALYSPNPSLNLVNQFPFRLQYFSNPDYLKTSIKTHVIEGAVMYNLERNMDAVRHMNLGRLNSGKHPNLRRCSRCQSISQIHANVLMRNHSIRAWDGRFSYRCVCSGSWQ
jgi:mediator of RNA polymerase II transcription subunit 16